MLRLTCNVVMGLTKIWCRYGLGLTLDMGEFGGFLFVWIYFWFLQRMVLVAQEYLPRMLEKKKFVNG